MHRLITALARGAVLALALAGLPAHALQILLTNDDGFETANLRALQARLKAAGHDVIVSAPTQNNSGTGGWITFFKPVGPLARDSRYGGVKAGAPGVGADPDDADAYYVDGTPVMSLLYGLDVVAPKRWGKAPDLVISGPNEGNNLGAIVVSSGTVSNALYAVNRGIPAIAVSHADFGSRTHKALAPGAIEYEIADVVVTLVAAVEAAKEGGELLPHGLALNVNIPKFAAGQGGALPFMLTRLGTASSVVPVFYEQLADSPLAQRMKAGVAAPGISFVRSALPSDSALSSAGHATPAGVPEAKPQDRAKIRSRLDKLAQ